MPQRYPPTKPIPSSPLRQCSYTSTSMSTQRTPLLVCTGTGTDASPRARLGPISPPSTPLVSPVRSPRSPRSLRYVEKTPLYVVAEDDEDLEDCRPSKGCRVGRDWRGAIRVLDGRRKLWGPVLLVLVLLTGTATLFLTGFTEREAWRVVSDIPRSFFGKAGQLGPWDTALDLGAGMISQSGGGESAGPKADVGSYGPKSTTDDGLLHRLPYNPDLGPGSSPHPITYLIDQAQAAWAEKNARQSRTLREAVEEYRRRYGRAPPAGFEKWWKYVKTHNVPLPDEYDQISHDVHSFHPHRPHAFSAKQAQAVDLPNTYILRNTGGNLSVSHDLNADISLAARRRIQAQLDVIKEVAGDIGDFDAVWSLQDTGRAFMSLSQRRALDVAGAGGNFIDDEVVEEQRGWSALCPPSTDFAAGFAATRSPPPSSQKSFISSHLLSSSICDQPSLVPLHSATAGDHRAPVTSGHLSIFSSSRLSVQSDIIAVPYSPSTAQASTPWESKTEDRLLWRGELTGPIADDTADWRMTEQARLLDLHKAGPTSVLVPTSGASPELSEATYADAAKRYLDVGATGLSAQCDSPACAGIANDYTFVPRMKDIDAGRYKYALDLDGDAGFRELLSTGSVVLKSTIMAEWWSDRVQPWVHYVPVKVDYTDLMDVMAYFTGDLTPAKANGNDTAARTIAEAGQNWAATHWREEDMTAYMFRLYLEWARVWGSEDRLSGYTYDEKDEVDTAQI